MNERQEAFLVLKQVLLEDGYASLLMRNRFSHASKQEIALITQLVYGTLQNQYYVRYQWEYLVNKKVSKEIAILLDMSVYQLWKLDKIPAYACINDAVNISKKIAKGSYSSLVNAVLRNVVRNGFREVEGDEVKKLSIMTSHPEWLVRMWKAHYGWDITKQLCEYSLLVKPMVARVNPLLTSKEELLKNPLFTNGKLAPNALYYDGNLLDSDEFKTGKVSIQDEASQMVACLVDPQVGDSILDMCAAPGTKGIQMAQMMKNMGRIVCLDIHQHRVELIKKGVEKHGISIIEAKCMDATKCHELGETFDKVVLDAPCSGLGVLGQKPDLKLRIQPENLDEIVALQKQLLDTAAMVCKENGVLVYSTCTLNKKENEKQIESFLKRHEEFTLVSERSYFPYEYDTDGFYMAKLVKSGKM